MSNGSLGSYYISLGMKSDYDAFNRGKKAVEGVSNSVSRLLGTVRNASVIVATGLGTMMNVTGGLAAKDLMLAESMSMSTKSLKAWQSVARMSHTNVDALIGSIAALDSKIWRLTKDGKPDPQLLESWQKLRSAAGKTNAEFNKIDDQQFFRMSAEDRAKTIIRMGQEIKDKTDAAMYVGDLLGAAGKDLTTYLHMTGKDFDTMFADGMSRVFETEEGMKAGMELQETFGKTVETLKSVASETANQLGGGLVPIFESVNKYFADHGKEITERITGFSNDIQKIATTLAPLWGPPLELLSICCSI